jgi:acyl-CoA thioesterase
MLNGRTLAGLVAWATERDHGDEAYQPARLTVDMFRSVPVAPLAVTTTRVRDGRRVRVVDVTLRQGDVEVSRGSVVLLRRGDPPPGEVFAAPAWHAPDPDVLPTLEGGPPWESRPVGGDGRSFGRAAWVRERVPFVEGEPHTPFLRAALAADVTNLLANSGDRGLGYINADLTLYLVRPPDGEWIGCEATDHGDAAGVAFGSSSLYDRRGRIGHAALCAVADGRLVRPAAGSAPPAG